MESFRQRDDGIVPASGWRTDQNTARGYMEKEAWTALDRPEASEQCGLRSRSTEVTHGGKGKMFRGETSTAPAANGIWYREPPQGRRPAGNTKIYMEM